MHYIHVNQQRIRANQKRLQAGETELEPVVTAKPARSQTGAYGNVVEILDREGNPIARVRYEPHHPLPCGAKCWVEADHGVRVLE